jgi:hypothetical protein
LLAQVLLLHLLRELRFHFVERRRFYRLRVFQQDHVVAELRLHRHLGDLALLELGYGSAEFRHHLRRIEPS